MKIDLNSLDSVRSTAEEFNEKSKTLNILIHIADVIATPEGRMADGFETQSGTNHLAHFLLFQLLKPNLLTSATPSFNSRNVCLSSSGYLGVGIQFDNYNFEKGDYAPWTAYGRSKTANIYMANEIELLYGANGLHGLRVIPRGIVTGLQVHVIDQISDALDAPRNYMKSPEQDAATTVYAALSKEWQGR